MSDGNKIGGNPGSFFSKLQDAFKEGLKTSGDTPSVPSDKSDLSSSIGTGLQKGADILKAAVTSPAAKEISKAAGSVLTLALKKGANLAADMAKQGTTGAVRGAFENVVTSIGLDPAKLKDQAAELAKTGKEKFGDFVNVVKTGEVHPGEIDGLKKQVLQAEEKVVISSEERAEMKRRAETKQKMLESLNNQLVLAGVENASLTEKNKALEESVGVKDSGLKQIEEQLGQVNTKNSEQAAEIVRLNERIAELTKGIEETTKEKDAKLLELAGQLEQSGKKSEGQSSEIEKLNLQIAGLSKGIAGKNVTIMENEDELSKLQEVVTQKDQELASNSLELAVYSEINRRFLVNLIADMVCEETPKEKLWPLYGGTSTTDHIVKDLINENGKIQIPYDKIPIYHGYGDINQNNISEKVETFRKDIQDIFTDNLLGIKGLKREDTSWKKMKPVINDILNCVSSRSPETHENIFTKHQISPNDAGKWEKVWQVSQNMFGIY